MKHVLLAAAFTLTAFAVLTPTAAASGCDGGTGVYVSGVAGAKVKNGDVWACGPMQNEWLLDIENPGDVGAVATLYYCHPTVGGCTDWVGPVGVWVDGNDVCIEPSLGNPCITEDL